MQDSVSELSDGTRLLFLQQMWEDTSERVCVQGREEALQVQLQRIKDEKQECVDREEQTDQRGCKLSV